MNMHQTIVLDMYTIFPLTLYFARFEKKKPINFYKKKKYLLGIKFHLFFTERFISMKIFNYIGL